jgi:glucose/arabinose dehydrogenase
MDLKRPGRGLLCALFAAPMILACGAGRSEPAAAAPTRTATQPPAATVVAKAPGATAAAPTIAPLSGASAAGTPRSAPVPAPPAAARAQVDPSTIRLGFEPLPARVDRPVHVTHAGDGSGRLFVVEKRGRIVILRDGQALPTPFLDISAIVGSSGSEQGLLGLAFHPRYAENGRFFVNYTDRSGDTVVAGYQASADPNVADPGSAKQILSIDQPAPNHNGGLVLFGPDGYLWIGTGDGGGAGDRFGNGQNRQSLLGKMLRIDVDSGDPYGIPPDNPFVGSPDARPEIWAIGLRNPWRYAFDRATGDLFIADVGQNAWEEVHVQRAGSRGGENYGWPRMEGKHCYPADSRCETSGLVLPVAEYSRDLGISVTGGHVYRGSASPSLTGLYFFADYGSGRVWSLDEPSPDTWRMVELADTSIQISSFGEDEAGELYVAGLGDGRIYRITAS